MHIVHEIYKTEYKLFSIETLDRAELNITYNIEILSLGFSGSYPFCLHTDNITIIANQLKKMYDNLSGEVVVSDEDSDSFLNIKFSENGKVNITGLLGGSYSDHMMKFFMEVDQSILLPLRSALLEEM